MRVYRLLLGLFAASLLPAYGQVPEDASLSFLLQIVNISGPLTADTRVTFLESSGLSADQVHIVSDAANHVISGSISNLEGSAARIRNGPAADLAALEQERHEILYSLAANLEERLGADGWAKFHSLLISIEQQIKVHRGICNHNSLVYSFEMLLTGHGSMTAIAVADDFNPAGQRHLYAEASLSSPDGRHVSAQSPASSYRIHAAAIAALQIEAEDGTYQSSYKFGEFCGEDKVPRTYTDPQN
jgi:hypothetical protein